MLIYFLISLAFFVLSFAFFSFGKKASEEEKEIAYLYVELTIASFVFALIFLFMFQNLIE